MLKTLPAYPGIDGLLGLQIHTLTSLASTQPLPQSVQLIDNSQRLFLLSNIIKNYPKFLRSASPIQLAQDLLILFDELYLQSVELPGSVDEMQQFLTQAYQIKQKKFTALDDEANIIITLWQAWHTELADRKLLDENMLFAQQLAQQLQSTHKQQRWYVLFLSDALNDVEYQWLKKT